MLNKTIGFEYSILWSKVIRELFHYRDKTRLFRSKRQGCFIPKRQKSTTNSFQENFIFIRERIHESLRQVSSVHLPKRIPKRLQRRQNHRKRQTSPHFSTILPHEIKYNFAAALAGYDDWSSSCRVHLRIRLLRRSVRPLHRHILRHHRHILRRRRDVHHRRLHLHGAWPR